AYEQRVGVVRVEVDVLGVGDVRWCRETPFRRVHRPESRQLGPAPSEIVAEEQVRGFGPREDTHATGQTGAGEAVDIVLREPMVPPLPGLAAVCAGHDRAVLGAGEKRAALGLEQ